MKRLADCDIRIVKRKRIGRWSWRNVLRKLLSYVNISYTIAYDTTDWLANFDTVFSIGGDIYTLSSTVRVEGGISPMVNVKTASDIPKA